MVPAAGVELFAMSHYSFLEGASSPAALVESAAEREVSTLGICDRFGLHGVPEFLQACKEHQIQPVLGALVEIDGAPIRVLCRSQEGYKALSRFLTAAHEGRPKGEPLATWPLFERYAKDWIACMETVEALEKCPLEMRYLIGVHQKRQGDEGRIRHLKQSGYPVLMSHLPRYARAENGHLHDVLICIKDRVSLDEAHHHLSGNHEQYLQGVDCPLAREVAEQCHYAIQFSDARIPLFEPPQGMTHHEYLTKLCLDFGCQYKEKLFEELALIERLGLSGYFLVVWDIVQFAKRKGIPCQGRGSAANSLVAYTLGITPVDPVKHKLFLGRFLNDDMQSMPDIDLDFASSRHPAWPDREAVIQYIYEKYGKEHVAMVCTYVTFQGRMALREVGKVLQIPEPIVARMSKIAGHGSVGHALEVIEEQEEFQEFCKSSEWSHYKRMLEQIAGIPRHMGIHVGGMLVTSRPLAEIVPLEPARMEGRVVCQWDKDLVEDAGLIKIDILGLGMLAVLRECEELSGIGRYQIPEEDPAVYEMIGKAETVGVFQVESRAQMQSLPRTRPKNFDELGIQIAIIRPGPLQGNMVAPYIRRKQGKEKAEVLHPCLEPVLADTLGVILFQEQVLQVATAIAGFTPGEADGLRRAMSRKRSKEAMQQIKGRFDAGAKKRGISQQIADRVFQTLEGFALYGFCKSHALSFAKIAYQSGWYKVHAPAAFIAALLNNQPMGFYSSATLIEEGKRLGVEVLGIDVNASGVRCGLEGEGLRLGLQMVSALQGYQAEEIVAKRPFYSLRELVVRCEFRRAVYEDLIQSGALDSFGLSRRELLWQLWLLQKEGVEKTLFGDEMPKSPPLAPTPEWEQVWEEMGASGLSHVHPMALLRRQVQQKGWLSSQELKEAPAGEILRVSGMVICRQRPPTARGFCFLTLEDEEGMINIVVPPDLFQEKRAVLRTESFLAFVGIKQEQDGVVNFKALGLDSIL